MTAGISFLTLQAKKGIRRFMALNKQRSVVDPVVRDRQSTPSSVAEEILEKKLDDIATILCKMGTDKKNRIYEEIMAMVERSLVRIALRRSNNVKSAAAVYLGINRNTFQKKMVNLGIDHDPE
jgi:DNA-binding protein Fis